MKLAIIYRSMTGHSKKIAKAIGAEIGVEPLDIKKKPQLDGVDISFVIGGIYSGESLPDMLEFVKTLTPSATKEVALITSSTSDKIGQDEVRSILKSNGIKVYEEEYRCRGNFLFIKIGHPNKQEITGAIEFAKKIKDVQK